MSCSTVQQMMGWNIFVWFGKWAFLSVLGLNSTRLLNVCLVCVFFLRLADRI